MADAFTVFCDFDGTITCEDTLEQFLQPFFPVPMRQLARDYDQRGFTIRSAIQEMFAAIPSEAYRHRTAEFSPAPVRQGFRHFAAWLKERQIPLVVVSGGLDWMVADTLAKEKAAVAAQYAAQVDDSGPFCRIHSQWESQVELLDKRAVMALWEPGFNVVIGDSYTDVLAAQQADLVFARDRLAEALQKSGQPYYPFDTFYDILNVLNKILLEQEGRSMRELECKLRCTPADHARVRESCEKMGLVRQDEIRELDQYYTTENRDFLQEDRALRLRRVQKGLEQMCKITYKGPNRTPGIQDREELETRVEDGETAARILSALGCRVLAQVDKRRETYRLEPLSVCLDQVAELGSFVEIELLSEEENVERLEEIRRELGLEAAQLEGRTYLELILRGEGR